MQWTELTQPVSSLPGFGKSAQKSLSGAGINQIRDLMWLLPNRYEDRKTLRPIRQSEAGPVNTVVTIIAYDYFFWKGKKSLKIIVKDETSAAELICYNRFFLKEQLKEGQKYRIYGIFQWKYGNYQCSAFEIESEESQPVLFGRILPVYPLTGTLKQAQIRKALFYCCEKYLPLLDPNTTPYSHLEIVSAFKAVHLPESETEADQGRLRLAAYELLLFQINLVRRYKETTHPRAQPFHNGPFTLLEKAKQDLPFDLTADQVSSLQAICNDIRNGKRMHRLLQGEVGSGKTLIAFLSALPYLEKGYKVALMAPTELLSRQHAANAEKFFNPFGIKVHCQTGSMDSNQKIESGEILLNESPVFVVGTHALFSEKIRYNKLAYIIVDEQHRFGVSQRMELVSKADNPDILLMSATPIPRTLALTAFGDLDISTLRTMPKGRIPIVTHLARMGNEEKVYRFVLNELRKGRQIYFVYPLISESEKIDLKNAEDMYRELAARFRNFPSALIHSKIDSTEKDSVMKQFAAGDLRILVATSVIEVGIDVPNSTVMVIEHAERFGLAALHQLRGRVGRGPFPSYCFLVYDGNLTEEGKIRMKTMKNFNDGFAIAEVDLKLRGPGEMSGVKQSGYLRFRAADLTKDSKLLLEMRQLAERIIADDPGLIKAENNSIRSILAANGQAGSMFMPLG